MDDLIEEFITETSAALTQLEPHLATLKTPNPQAVPAAAYEIVRAVKSASGFLGLPRLEALARAGETLLGNLRKTTPSAEQATLVLTLFTRLNTLVAGLAKAGAEPVGNDSALIAQLTDAAPTAPAPAAAPTRTAKPAAKKTKAKTTAKKKKPKTIDATPARTLNAAAEAPRTTSSAAITSPAAASSKASTTSKKKASTSTLERIHIRREAFEQLLQLVAEMVQARNQLLHHAPQSVSPQFYESLEHLSRLVTTLKDGMLSKQASTSPASLPAAPKIIPSLQLNLGAQRFAIAKESVSGLVQIGGETGYTVEANNMLRLRDRMVPLTALSDILGVKPHQKPGQGYVAILRIGTAEVGLIADSIGEGEELVIQPLSRALARLNAFCGSAIMGDGRPVLVLDAHIIARVAGERALLAHQPAAPTKQQLAAATPQHAPRPSSFLIFSAGNGVKAVPLERVQRLETIQAADIKLSAQGGSMQYQGEALTLRGAPGVRIPTQGEQHVIVLRNGDQTLGLLADKIIDILMTPLEIGLGHKQDGYIGSAMIAHQPTDIVDTDALFAEEDA